MAESGFRGRFATHRLETCESSPYEKPVLSVELLIVRPLLRRRRDGGVRLRRRRRVLLIRCRIITGVITGVIRVLRWFLQRYGDQVAAPRQRVARFLSPRRGIVHSFGLIVKFRLLTVVERRSCRDRLHPSVRLPPNIVRFRIVNAELVSHVIVRLRRNMPVIYMCLKNIRKALNLKQFPSLRLAHL